MDPLTSANNWFTERKGIQDPFRIFEVTPGQCLKIDVTVVGATNVTKGSIGDYLDTADPYVSVHIRSAAESKKTTRTIDNELNPIWNETLTFYINYRDSIDESIHVTLMDANYLLDETLVQTTLYVKDLTIGKTKHFSLEWENATKLELDILAEFSEPALRFSLALSDDEKAFLKARKQRVFHSMQRILGDRGPRNLDEVPTIGVLGSGGGFRAMVSLSGVFKALSDTGLLDMVTYVAGLSGSSWYLASTYSDPDWPAKTPGQVQEELRASMAASWVQRSLTYATMSRYVGTVMQKYRNGQPISFTDFFGHLVGDTILGDVRERTNRKDMKLSAQQDCVKDGLCPLPLYTCLHVKESVDARRFHEWVEFSPYEVGMAKYGTFMRTELFGSMFFTGSLVKRFPESPLHYLIGVWGSAFCILFKRLVEANKPSLIPTDTGGEEELARSNVDDETDQAEIINNSDDDSDDDDSSDEDDVDAADIPRTRAEREEAKRKREEGRELKRRGRWQNILKSAFTSRSMPFVGSRAGRAGMVHNFMRGVSLETTYPISPFSSMDEVDSADTTDPFKDIHKPLRTKKKRIYLVDSGLTFNSPYPLLLRPQRGVRLYLSFDFSARETDASQPFKELKLAEIWALKNCIPFPPIDTSEFEREGMKTVFVFKDDKNPECPVVLHFPLVNIDFRRYKKPGVPRTTREELDFADFSLFEDPNSPYSTFNFTYTEQSFNRLAQLTEFNTLQNVDVINAAIADAILHRRRNPPTNPLAALTRRRNFMRQLLRSNQATVASPGDGEEKVDAKEESGDAKEEEEEEEVWYDAVETLPRRVVFEVTRNTLHYV
ncbi:PREDICTED: cytosolic phospholipase A2-like isoform X2 [Priapulus caudatus]|uniref:Phospholipase A2 n=1 Tax=Priapulus caudatus TaxID=37621 RepID=A0ABM1EE83_PRICU|nr:PREDICTED: cytosolic phospholipase A2-like isoform X2 [Priapulus caudatus]